MMDQPPVFARYGVFLLISFVAFWVLRARMPERRWTATIAFGGLLIGSLLGAVFTLSVTFGTAPSHTPMISAGSASQLIASALHILFGVAMTSAIGAALGWPASACAGLLYPIMRSRMGAGLPVLVVLAILSGTVGIAVTTAFQVFYLIPGFTLNLMGLPGDLRYKSDHIFYLGSSLCSALALGAIIRRR